MWGDDLFSDAHWLGCISRTPLSLDSRPYGGGGVGSLLILRDFRLTRAREARMDWKRNPGSAVA